MPQTKPPAWIAAATSAAVRLAAEAGAEVDDILEHAGGSADRLDASITRLEESADVTEVATDLAGLLWAECEDVAPIATILGEPATQAALEAVAEARRQAAQRLTAAALLVQATEEREPRPTLTSLRSWAEAVDGDQLALDLAPADSVLPATSAPTTDAVLPSDGALTVEAALPTSGASTAEGAPPVAALPAVEVATPPPPEPAAAPPFAARIAVAPAPRIPARPATPAAGGSTRHPATGAVLAGAAAAAILLFGRRLRRA